MNAVIPGSAPGWADVAATSPWCGEVHASTAPPQASRNVPILCRSMNDPRHEVKRVPGAGGTEAVHQARGLADLPLLATVVATVRLANAGCRWPLYRVRHR